MMPTEAGPFNGHPALITPGPTVHCWDLINAGELGTSYGSVLIQLVDAATLKIEGRLGGGPLASCVNEQTVAFTNAVVTFGR